MKIVSACLCGIPCRYDGESREDPELMELVARGEAIPVCPEQLGGLPTPRIPAELNGSGELVFSGEAQAIRADGQDVSEAFMLGAYAALAIAEEHGAEEAILKAKSPSCGKGKIYDGSFTRTLTEGDGVTAALFEQHGIRVESR